MARRPAAGAGRDRSAAHQPGRAALAGGPGPGLAGRRSDPGRRLSRSGGSLRGGRRLQAAGRPPRGRARADRGAHRTARHRRVGRDPRQGAGAAIEQPALHAVGRRPGAGRPFAGRRGGDDRDGDRQAAGPGDLVGQQAADDRPAAGRASRARVRRRADRCDAGVRPVRAEGGRPAAGVERDRPAWSGRARWPAADRDPARERADRAGDAAGRSRGLPRAAARRRVVGRPARARRSGGRPGPAVSPAAGAAGALRLDLPAGRDDGRRGAAGARRAPPGGGADRSTGPRDGRRSGSAASAGRNHITGVV